MPQVLLGTSNPLFVLALFLNILHSGQVVAGATNVHDIERILADAPMLQQKMKPRHLTMIAVGESLRCFLGVYSSLTRVSGGSIGTGLFVGSGSALQRGGPAGVLIAWILIGIMLINVTQVRSDRQHGSIDRVLTM